MSDVAIRVDNLSKAYRIGAREKAQDTLAQAALSWLCSPLQGFHRLRRLNTRNARGDEEDIFWALRDVSFAVRPGEVVGIIGRNGAGKSTLLKLLSRITDPTRGRAEIHGRVGSLLEVGTGFHPDLTGRENIYMNGTILGMTKREIDRKFDEIVDFSGVERFLDTPIKRYSSGMTVRLAFSVAANLEPEVLIIDEVLAVGDVEFQNRCLGKMGQVARSGRTILFVSHNMAAVEALCTRCILLVDGRLQSEGPPNDVTAEYMTLAKASRVSAASLRNHARRRADSVPLMNTVRLADDNGRPCSTLRMGSRLSICVDFEKHGQPFSPVIGVLVRNHLGIPMFTVNNRFIPGFRYPLSAEPGTITCQLDALPLMPGPYYIDLYLGGDHKDIDIVEQAISFEVVQTDVYGSGKLPPPACGSLYHRATWSLTRDNGYHVNAFPQEKPADSTPLQLPL